MASTGTAVILMPIEIYGTYIHIETLDLENLWYMHIAQCPDMYINRKEMGQWT